jgi:hypothetical protein
MVRMETDMNFLKGIAENEMMDHKCNEELRTININNTINKRGKVHIMQICATTAAGEKQ